MCRRIGKQLWHINPHAAERPHCPLRLILRHRFPLQGKIAFRMMRRIRHQPQMRQLPLLLHFSGNLRRVAKRNLRQHIAVHHQKRFVAQKRQRRGNAACRFQTACRFGRIGNAHTVCATVAQGFFNLPPQPGMVNHNLVKSGRAQAAQMPANQRLFAHAQQRFGRVVGQRTHSFASSGG